MILWQIEIIVTAKLFWNVSRDLLP
jgi:hypothetical protein